jgi:hypothetical protein
MDDTAQPHGNPVAYRVTDPELHALEQAATAEVGPLTSFIGGGPVDAELAPVESPPSYVLTADQVRAAALELDVPAEPTRVARPDGRPGVTEQIENGTWLPPEQPPVGGYRLREGDQPLPTAGEGPVIHELVITDLANRLELGKKRYGQPLRAFNGRRSLQDAYDEVLDLAVYLRQRIEEDAARAREAEASGVEVVPDPPANRARVAVVEGQPWLWHPGQRQWVPMVPNLVEELDAETRAAVEAHIGPLAG